VVELEFFQIFLPYSFRLIGSQTKQGNMHPWSVKTGLKKSVSISTDLRLPLESQKMSVSISTDLRLTLESLKKSVSISTDLRLPLESLKNL
jgi:hypothetical protein